jgi:hypothetical protein
VKRWTIILGRGGTVLIAISLALLLVSLIPPQQIGSGVGITEVPARTFSPLDRSPPDFPGQLMFYYDNILTPQRGVEIELTANGTITAYVLEVDTYTMFDWIREQHGLAHDLNVTSLEEFLEAHPNSIGWQKELDEETVEYTYIPTKVTNVTIVYSNPSSENIGISHSYVEKSFIAPGNKVQNIALWTTPIGLILTIPWVASLWKQRKHK